MESLNFLTIIRRIFGAIGVILHYKSLSSIRHIFLSLMSGGNYKDVYA